VIASWTRNLDPVKQGAERRERRLCRGRLLGCDLSQIRVIREILDVVLFVIGSIIRLKRHAIVTHSLGPVLAELGVFVPRNFSILCAPVFVYRIFLDEVRGGLGNFRW